MKKFMSLIRIVYNHGEGWVMHKYAIAGLLTSVALLIMFVAVSFFIPTKALGVGVATAGAFVSGCLFMSFLKRVEESSKQDRENAEELKAETDKLRAELDEAKLALDNMKGQRIDVNSIMPIMKLALGEIDMTTRSFVEEWKDDFDDGVFTDTRSKYIGLLEKKFKANVGVDMRKLRFRAEGDRIVVSGLKAEHIGFQQLTEDKWLLRQNQKYTLKSAPAYADGTQYNPTETFEKNGKRYTIDRIHAPEVDIDLNNLEASSHKQLEGLNKQINELNGPGFAMFNKYVVNLTREFLTVLLNPLAKKIEFITDDTKHDAGLPLNEFVSECNKQMALACK